MLHGVASSGTAGGDPDLAINQLQVGVDSAGTDDELFSHLLICESPCHESQDLLLARRQSSGIFQRRRYLLTDHLYLLFDRPSKFLLYIRYDISYCQGWNCYLILLLPDIRREMF